MWLVEHWRAKVCACLVLLCLCVSDSKRHNSCCLCVAVMAARQRHTRKITAALWLTTSSVRPVCPGPAPDQPPRPGVVCTDGSGAGRGLSADRLGLVYGAWCLCGRLLRLVPGKYPLASAARIQIASFDCFAFTHHYKAWSFAACVACRKSR